MSGSINTKVPHKHADLIKAWADGATIQMRMGSSHGKWEDYEVDDTPWWLVDCGVAYRIKPEPKPDIVRYSTLGSYGTDCTSANCRDRHNIKHTYDGETGKLKAVELIK